MDDNKTIRHLFSMDKKSFLTYERKILDLTPSANELLKDLNRPEALDRAGRRELLIGGGLTTLGVVLAAVSGESTGLFAGAFLAGSAGLWFVVIGWKGVARAATIRRRAYDRMCSFEGEVGVLWRFEQFLADFDSVLPEPVRDTLPSLCIASKCGSLKGDHASLRAYWYWVSSIQDRMEVAKSMMSW